MSIPPESVTKGFLTFSGAIEMWHWTKWVKNSDKGLKCLFHAIERTDMVRDLLNINPKNQPLGKYPTQNI